MKKYKQRKSSVVAKIVTVGCASLVLAGCIGFGFASAGSTSAHVDAFGIDQMSTSVSSADSASLTQSVDDEAARETTVLVNTAKRDISKGIQAIEAKEEADRIAAEAAARAEEEARIAAASEKMAQQQATAPAPAAVDLSEVDWSVGKEAFVAEWTQRIDAYLAGSPLAGQGVVFAAAAWSNGIDPRWSPAISNTESSKGAVCFLPYNAWGWGQSGFSGWEEAINTHVAGLAKGYGYTISMAYAQKYCPPNSVHWFNTTLSQMRMI